MSANPAPGRQRQGNHRGQPGVCGETLSQNNKKIEKEKKNWLSLSLEKEIKKKLEQLASYSQGLINNCHKGFSFFFFLKKYMSSGLVDLCFVHSFRGCITLSQRFPFQMISFGTCKSHLEK